MEILLALGAVGAVVVPFIVYYLNRRDGKKNYDEARELAEAQAKAAADVQRRQRQLAQAAKVRQRVQAETPQITVKTVEVMVVGQPGVGKTQLIWTEQGKEGRPAPTVAKTMEEFLRATIVDGTKYAFNYLIPDIGGENLYLGDVHKELISRRPRGLIFVVDHSSQEIEDFDANRVEKHMRTVYSVLGPLGDSSVSRCELILFLINKQDLWSKKYSDQHAKDAFAEHVEELATTGANVLVECVSARTGAGIARALTALERRLIGSSS